MNQPLPSVLNAMAARTGRSRRSFGVALIGAFAAMLVAFSVATIYSEVRGRDVEGAAVTIATVCAPTIQRLATARTSLTQLRVAQSEYMQAVAAGQTPARDLFRFGPQILATASAVYADLPPGLPPDQVAPTWQAARQRLAALGAALTALAQVSTTDSEAVRVANQRFRGQAEQVATTIADSVDLIAGQAKQLALHIQAVSGHRRQLSLILLVACGIATVVAATLLRRAMRVHDQLNRVHNQLLEGRSAELEAFSGRVAHDVRGSLTAVSLTLQQIARSRRDDTQIVGLARRGERNLDSAIALVDGLLGFARAGARAELGARADVGKVLDDVLALRRAEAAAAGIEIESACDVDGSAGDTVACSAGVLNSLLSNLIGNAIKHMGDSPRRKISVRVLARGAIVRVEVEDTGPGIPDGQRDLIFDPFVRGSATGTPGIGLGLATVKRLVEGHGGQVGVEAAPRGGSLFWFELSRSAPAATRPQATAVAAERV
jgi:signal transduction histidine kinase